MVQAQYFTPGLYSAEQAPQAPQPVFDLQPVYEPAVPVRAAPMQQPMMIGMPSKPQVPASRVRPCAARLAQPGF